MYLLLLSQVEFFATTFYFLKSRHFKSTTFDNTALGPAMYKLYKLCIFILWSVFARFFHKYVNLIVSTFKIWFIKQLIALPEDSLEY